MVKAAVLFNGIKLSFAVIDHAFSWAKQSGASMVAIFLKAEKDPGEGYLFPSDLDAAENLAGSQEAQTNYETIIKSNIRMIEHQASNAQIELRTVLLSDPEEEVLLDELGGCERIFASGQITETGTLTVDSIDLKKLLKELPVPVEIIEE